MLSKQFVPVSKNEFIVGTILLLVTAFSVAGMRWATLYNGQAISSDKPAHLYLDKRTTLDELSSILVDSSYVESEEELRWAANLLGWRNFQAGHYLIDEPYEYEEFLSKLARGIQDPVSVTILPGRTKGDIVTKVANQLQFDSLTFHQTLKDSIFIAKHELDQKDVVGRLFPNTYSVYWTISPESFFKRILNEFDKAVIESEQEQMEELNRSVDEIITLASIIEWEARNREEKRTISGLYWNRLNRGMRLQADPTVNFAVGERRRLLYEDYQVDHPYNTYLYRGLPPGPITNPDLVSIRSALYPEDHDYLYMVATPKGEHAFSKTFEEHKQKSAKWRKWLQEQYRIKRNNEQKQNGN
ncbi:endolytic transglycosylase MltG [Aliifodinibius salipaludis]|uniref:endolytic transglycosylase MltG n=1 Tax=Fodinibius salipaludis TaxID=2032627 RepID=UPI00159504DC|nr:endolytic transglycosylase MltG [Aliifodinibius salipaludis]